VSAAIVGIGEPSAGDDGVGFRVVERLRPLLDRSYRVELSMLRDPSELTSLLPGRERALVIDALLDPEQEGAVELRDARGLARKARMRAAPVSSHGLDVLSAIELARSLASGQSFPEVSVLTIAIRRPTRLEPSLSRTAERAAESAVARALDWARGVTVGHR
jgi:hydrogenase maturation protease